MSEPREPNKDRPKYIHSNNKKWFDQQVASLVAKGWTIESQKEKDGFYSAKLVFKQ